MKEELIKERDSKIDNDERLYINVVRGTAIFLMLWGHCIQCCCAGSFDFFENAVFKFIYSFHMPLFMLISGYLFWYSFQKRSLGDLLIHKAQALLQPIVICGILSFFMVDVVFDVVLNQHFAKLLDGAWLNHLRDFWFLWSVLAASLTLALAFKITEKFWLQFVLAGIGVGFVALFPCAGNNIFMYPYFVLGFLFGKFKETNWLKKLMKLQYVLAAMFLVMLPFYKKEHYIYTSGLTGSEGIIKHMPENMFRWAIGLAGSVFILEIIKLVIKLTNRGVHQDIYCKA